MTPRNMVYQYGCPHWAEFDETAMEQLWLANQFWNDLVAVWRNYEAAENDMLIQYSTDVADAQSDVEDAAALVVELIDQMGKHRQQARTTSPDPQKKAALQRARKESSAAKTQLKTAKRQAREAARPLLTELRNARQESMKATRQAAAAAGLFWGTYNDVERRRFRPAVKRMMEKRSNREPAELHFHRFDGSGTLSTQIMWQSGMPLATVDRLTEGWRGAARLEVEKKHGKLTLQVAANHKITVPFIYHRPIPANAEIKEIKVSRRRTGSQWRLSVAICVRVPEPAQRTNGHRLSVIMQQETVSGKTCVAQILSNQPLPPPPADVANIVELSDNRHAARIYYSNEWRSLLARDDGIREIRDRNLNDLRLDLITQLADEELAETVDASATQVARWKAFHRFASLARRWPADHPFHDKITTWQQRDKHLWDYEANERQQVIARRDDSYRKISAWLLADAKSIGIDGFNLAERRRIPDVSQEDPHRSRNGRAASQAAAPGALRAALTNAATMRGVTQLNLV